MKKLLIALFAIALMQACKTAQVPTQKLSKEDSLLIESQKRKQEYLNGWH